MNITAFAQYAGVSKAAVSRYFNGGYLSAEKRAQIEAAVEATGYRPSMQAQMLRTRRTRQIGVIMPRLSSESCARMVEGISRVLDDQNYQLLLINTAKGAQIFDVLPLHRQARTLEEAAACDAALRQPPTLTEERSKFFDALEQLPFQQVRTRYLSAVQHREGVGQRLRELLHRGGKEKKS